jgi:hypothetical protein
MTCASKVVIGVKSTAAADELPLLMTVTLLLATVVTLTLTFPLDPGFIEMICKINCVD